MTDLTDDQVRALLTEDKFVVEGSFNHTINRLARALLQARAELAACKAREAEALAELEKPNCLRVCTTDGGPNHAGQKWVHWADFQDLRKRVAAAIAAAPARTEEG